MGILYFLSLVTYTHFSYFLSHQSNTLEYHALGRDIENRRFANITFCLIPSWIRDFVFSSHTYCSISQIEHTIGKLFMSLVNQRSGYRYIPINPCYFRYFFVSMGDYPGQRRILSLHAIPFGWLTSFFGAFRDILQCFLENSLNPQITLENDISFVFVTSKLNSKWFWSIYWR